MRIYKIMSEEDWAEASATGVWHGSGDDRRDGFIHLSTAAQLAGTLEKHFSGRRGLVRVAFDADSLAPALKWEVSRGGAKFPHLYAPLDPALAVEVEPLPPPGTD